MLAGRAFSAARARAAGLVDALCDADGLLDLLSAGGSGYHFFDKLADRIVIERPV